MNIEEFAQTIVDLFQTAKHWTSVLYTWSSSFVVVVVFLK